MRPGARGRLPRTSGNLAGGLTAARRTRRFRQVTSRPRCKTSRVEDLSQIVGGTTREAQGTMSELSPSSLSDNEKAILLTVASLPREYAMDRLFFEKALFLLTRTGLDELDLLADSFEAYEKGPYSPMADDTLLRLGDLKLLQKGTMVITPEGSRLARELESDPEFQRVVDSSRAMWGVLRDQKFSRNDLLYLVYRLYPEYAAASTMKPEDTHSDRLEHFTVREEGVPEGGALVIRSDKGNRLSVSKRNGRLMLSPVAPG